MVRVPFTVVTVWGLVSYWLSLHYLFFHYHTSFVLDYEWLILCFLSSPIFVYFWLHLSLCHSYFFLYSFLRSSIFFTSFAPLYFSTFPLHFSPVSPLLSEPWNVIPSLRTFSSLPLHSPLLLLMLLLALTQHSFLLFLRTASLSVILLPDFRLYLPTEQLWSYIHASCLKILWEVLKNHIN